MQATCQEIQERLIAAAGVADPSDAAMREHLASCLECAVFGDRATRLARALSDLARRPVPAQLDGLVVAAINAGRREERAASALRRLPRLFAPTELGGRILAPAGTRAPGVLDRIVAEELADQPKAMTRRFTGRLKRLQAPGVLFDRLERPFDGRALPRWRRPLLAAAVLAALLLAGGVSLILSQRLKQRSLEDDGFEVRYVTSIDELHPMTKSLLAGLSGGLMGEYGGSVGAADTGSGAPGSVDGAAGARGGATGASGGRPGTAGERKDKL